MLVPFQKCYAENSTRVKFSCDTILAALLISFCILRKERIIAFAKTVWPDDKPTPWFRSNAENSKKLQEITKQLAEDESYTFRKAGLGIKAIEEIIRKYMQERRRKENDPLSSQSDQESSGGSSRDNPSILSTRQEKVQSYEAYFIDGKSLLISLLFCHQGTSFILPVLLLHFMLFSHALRKYQKQCLTN